MRLSDLLVNHLSAEYNVDTVFTITGGGAMYLNDAFGKHSAINYVPLHHEQSVSMAGEAYARVGNRLGVCQVTTGPGGTNALSGCAGAWIDSCPILFISGQVESFSLLKKGARQTGVQEVDIVSMVSSVTKAAHLLEDPNMILYHLDRLIYVAQCGRKGPVWLDIPLDIQNHHFSDISSLPRFKPMSVSTRQSDLLKVKVKKFISLLLKSKRPLLLLGNGFRSEAERVLHIASKYNLPIITGWNAKDLVPNSCDLLLGSAGQFGDRQSNLAVQHSDLLIGLGYRFSIPQIGYDPSLYAKRANIVSVDVDPAEITKYSGFIDIGIEAESTSFVTELINQLDADMSIPNYQDWKDRVISLKSFGFDCGPRDVNLIDSFDFTDALSGFLPEHSVVVTDMGTSFTCTHQQLKLRSGMRLMTSSGLAAMGFGLPGAIGACLAQKKSIVTLITGDGGIMFNLQELQSVVTLNAPIKIIIYENDGYLTMKLMQRGRFNRYVASDRNTGVECPNFAKVSEAFGLKTKSISNHCEIDEGLIWLYSDFEPAVLVVHIDPTQQLTPRVQTVSTEDGKLIPGTLENMYPFFSDKIRSDVSIILEGKE